LARPGFLNLSGLSSAMRLRDIVSGRLRPWGFLPPELLSSPRIHAISRAARDGVFHAT
jgi:hypothetical protein